MDLDQEIEILHKEREQAALEAAKKVENKYNQKLSKLENVRAKARVHEDFRSWLLDGLTELEALYLVSEQEARRKNSWYNAFVRGIKTQATQVEVPELGSCELVWLEYVATGNGKRSVVINATKTIVKKKRHFLSRKKSPSKDCHYTRIIREGDFTDPHGVDLIRTLKYRLKNAHVLPGHWETFN